MIRVKDGVSLDRLDAELWALIPALAECYWHRSIVEFWITSGTEHTTEHRGLPVAGDLEDPHYAGKAIDARLHNCPPALRPDLVDGVAGVLGCTERHESADGALVYTGPVFVLRWEYRGTAREHLHIQKGHVAPVAVA